MLDFRVRVLGWPIRWRVMIREFDPPYRFVDVQLWGPFARWEHRHRFAAGPPATASAGPIGTWVEDRVTYRLPFGPLGRPRARARRADGASPALFDHRERRLRQILG